MTCDSIDNGLFRTEETGHQKPPVKPKAPAGATKTFRSYDSSQMFLMPPSIDDWLPKDHTARFIAEVVNELLDLSVIYNSYVEAAGAPPFDPRMMLKLQLYAYSTGVTSSREMERRCHVDVAFRWLSANTTPDHRSFSRFRRRHLEALGDLFIQVLQLCSKAGLVKLGRVALDGTKLRANASRHKAMSYNHLIPRIDELEAEVASIVAEAEVASIVAEAEATDQAEDEAFGLDHRGDEVPDELAHRQSRLAKLGMAKEAIEADAKDKAKEQAIKTATKQGKDDLAVAEAASVAAEVAIADPKAQRNFTDPDSKMMKTNDGFHYPYNGQAVVDEGSQVILSAEITQGAADFNQLVPMIATTRKNLESIGIEAVPRVILADAGYCSDDNLKEIAKAKINALIATGRLKRAERVPDAPRGRIPNNATSRERMARRLRTKAGRKDYARRKAIVEPAFGALRV